MMQNSAREVKNASANTPGIYPMMPKGYTAARRAALRAFEKRIVKRITVKAK